MKTRGSRWQYSESVGPERIAELNSYNCFDEVVELVSNATVTAFCWEPFRGSALKGCNRASFLLRISSKAYDAFFNSPAGYRGQYANSNAAGEAANRSLIVLYEPVLAAFVCSHDPARKVKVIASLQAAEAKVWIYEAEVQAQLTGAPEILCKRWQARSEDGMGLRAPLGAQLEIKGGWLDSLDRAVPNPAKAERGMEIHSRGYT